MRAWYAQCACLCYSYIVTLLCKKIEPYKNSVIQYVFSDQIKDHGLIHWLMYYFSKLGWPKYIKNRNRWQYLKQKVKIWPFVLNLHWCQLVAWFYEILISKWCRIRMYVIWSFKICLVPNKNFLNMCLLGSLRSSFLYQILRLTED